MSRTARRLLLSAVACASALSGFVILELIFGTWLRQAESWDRALMLGITVSQRIISDATGLYDGGGRVVYTRDIYGLRGHYGDPGDISILTVGGSTTDERDTTDGFTWQDELERALRASGRNVRVANAGVGGMSTYGHLAAYHYWFPLIPRLRPAYTILYVGINDFVLDINDVDYGSELGDIPISLGTWIAGNSAFYRLFVRVRGAWWAWEAGLVGGRVDSRRIRYVDAPNIQDHEAIGRAQVRGFEWRMAALLSLVRATGSVPVCVTQPTMYYRRTPGGGVVGVDFEIAAIPAGKINGVDYFHLRAVQDAAMIASCRATGSVVIDLVADDWSDDDFIDLVHTTPRGSKKVGQRIANAMKTLPL